MSDSPPILLDRVNTCSPPCAKRADQWALRFLAVYAWFLIILCSCFWDRTPAFDEIGLHNPIYMYLHYGKMTYPAHGHFDNMVVHPPLHYAEIAWLMSLGLPLFSAAGVPLCILSLIALLLILHGRFPAPVKLGLIAGLFLGSFVWNWLITIRPEAHLALAWFTGLVALESSRLESWKPTWRILLGAFLITYASGVHYIGAAIWVGLVIYGFSTVCALGWKGSKKPLALMALGACLFAIPYFYFWVIPSWHAILQMTRAVQGKGGVSQAFHLYMNTYSIWKATYLTGGRNLRITDAAASIPICLGFPAALIGSGLLLIIPSTRCLGLAALPHLLFIMLYVRGGLKTAPYKGYYVPEFMAYLAGLFIVALTLMSWLLQKILRCSLRSVIVPGLAVVVGVIFACDIQNTPLLLTRQLADLEIARAAGRAMVGPDASLGITSAGVWYTSGGARVCFLAQDLLYPKDISGLDLNDYFAHYDALILYSHMSDVTFNCQRKTLSSCFADGTLQIKGFYFSDRRDWHECTMAYLALGLGRESARTGFGYRRGCLYRFQENEKGKEVFACYVCPLAEFSNKKLGELDFYVRFLLPARVFGQAPDRMLCAFVMQRDRYENVKPSLLAAGSLREEFPVIRSEVDTAEMLRRLRQQDKPLRLFASLEQMELFCKRCKPRQEQPAGKVRKEIASAPISHLRKN